jgi:hypothetical protein
MLGNRLTISGEKTFRNEVGGEDAAFHRVESSYGSFSRSVGLPDNVDPDKVDADYKNGVLTVTIPKAKAQAATRVQVKSKDEHAPPGHAARKPSAARVADELVEPRKARVGHRVRSSPEDAVSDRHVALLSMFGPGSASVAARDPGISKSVVSRKMRRRTTRSDGSEARGSGSDARRGRRPAPTVHAQPSRSHGTRPPSGRSGSEPSLSRRGAAHPLARRGSTTPPPWRMGTNLSRLAASPAYTRPFDVDPVPADRPGADRALAR